MSVQSLYPSVSAISRPHPEYNSTDLKSSVSREASTITMQSLSLRLSPSSFIKTSLLKH